MAEALNLIFRRVRLDDKPRVLDFTARTWNDGDYIVDVFDEWQADPAGQFTAVELEGQPVAIGKLTELGAGELWLEGIRVDPAQRRKGIGEALHNYHVDLARRLGGDVLRYATDQDNTISQLFGARTGFQHIGSYRWHVADASTHFAPPETLSLDDWPALPAWLASPLMQSTRGLYQRHQSLQWRWGALTESRLRAHLAAGQVFGLPGKPGLRAWSIGARLAGWDEAQVYHLDGIDQPSLVGMAQAMRGYAAESGAKRVATTALDPSPLIDALPEAGYHAEDFTLFIFELGLR